nr:ABC transporter permease [Cellulomonas denverensis]
MGRPLFRAHARANLVLAVLIAVATALMAGSFTVLIAAGTDRYLPGVPVPADDMLSEGAMSVLGWTLALTLFTATSLVSSMTAFTIDARLPEIARLRLTGATGRQVSRSIVTEVMGIGLLGSLAGCLLGWPAGAVINALLVRTEFAPAGLDVTPLPWSPAVVLGLGLVITFFGARPAARRAGRTDPLVAVTDVVPARRAMTATRWVVAVLGAGGLAALSTVRVTSTDDVFGFSLLTSLVSVTTLACLAPVLVPTVTRLLGAPLARWWPGPGLLAVEHTRYAVRRTAALALPVLLITALSGGLLTIVGTANGTPGTDSRADLVVLSAGAPLPADIAAGEGIAAVTELSVLAVTAVLDQTDPDDAPEEETWYLGAIDVAAAADQDLVTTTQRAGDGDAAAYPVASTDPGVLPLGATLAVVTPQDTPVVLTVTSVVDADPVLPAELLIDPDLVGAWATQVDTASVITLTGTADGDAVRDRLAAATAPAEVLTGTALAERQAAAADRQSRNAVIAILGGGIAMAACSIVLGGLSGAADRRREFGGLIRSGATDRQIVGSAVVETVLVLVVAALLAVADVAWVTWRLDVLLSWAEAPRVAVGTMAMALGAAAVLAVAATAGGTVWQLRRLSRQ